MVLALQLALARAQELVLTNIEVELNNTEKIGDRTGQTKAHRENNKIKGRMDKHYIYDG